MLVPSLYSFKSLVSRVVIRYRVMDGTKEHLLAPALFLREIDRQLLSDFTQLPSVPPALASRARMLLLAAAEIPNAHSRS